MEPIVAELTEVEARTAAHTRLLLEQLDREPCFRARLFWHRARKCVADLIGAGEDVEGDMPRHQTRRRSYLPFFCILVLGIYCGGCIARHGLENPLEAVSVRDGIASQDTAFGKPQSHASVAASIRAVPVFAAHIIFPGSQPGWCHTMKLWAQQPSCGPSRGVWDSATPSRAFGNDDDLAWAKGTYSQKRTAPEVQALGAQVQSVVEMLHSALPQQHQVNALFAHLLGELKSELSSLRVHQAAPRPATQQQAAPQLTQMPALDLVMAACVVLVLVLMLAGMIYMSYRQNKAQTATHALILAQLAATTARSEAAQRTMDEVQRSQSRMERADGEARADALQMYGSVYDSVASLEGRIDAVEASTSQLAGSMGAVSDEVLSWVNEGRADLAEARRELDSAAVERDSLRGELEEREAEAVAQAARMQELTGELQAAQAQAARLAASLDASALREGHLQQALVSMEEQLAEQADAVKRSAAEALEREAKLTAAEGARKLLHASCEQLRSENKHLQQTALDLEAALEKRLQWACEDGFLHAVREVQLVEAQADLQQRLQAAEEQARAATAEAERQRKAAALEMDKLLRFKNYEFMNRRQARSALAVAKTPAATQPMKTEVHHK